MDRSISCLVIYKLFCLVLGSSDGMLTLGFFGFFGLFWAFWEYLGFLGFLGFPKNNFLGFLSVPHLVDNYAKIVDGRGRNLMCHRTLLSRLVIFSFLVSLFLETLYSSLIVWREFRCSLFLEFNEKRKKRMKNVSFSLI